MARIVVADDSWLTRRVVVGLLEADGHEVVPATNGREAVEAVRRVGAACLILDLLMPEMNGFEVLEALKDDGVSVIVHTADIQSTTLARCRVLGAAAFLNKPVNEAALLAAVNEALAREEGRTHGAD